MIEFIRTDSSNKDFKALVELLDADLKVRDGDEHVFFAQFNGIDLLRHVVVGYSDGVAVGCGAIKLYSENTVEIKRMYVDAGQRGRGIASGLLKELEHWAAELGFYRCILETGVRQHEAIGLYKKNGYKVIDNFGQYSGVESSVCFDKKILAS